MKHPFKRAWFVPSDSKGHIGHLWEKPTEWQLEQPGWWVTMALPAEWVTEIPGEEGDKDE